MLVSVGQEEVLAVKPPVEKCSVQVFIHHFQVCRLADRCQRLFGRSYEPVLGVVIDEDPFGVADLVGERCVTVRKQDFIPFVVFQIGSVFGDSVYGQRVVASGM